MGLESRLERQCNIIGKTYGWVNRKFEVSSGDPDQQYFKSGKTFFIEYKQIGKKLKPHQELKKKFWENLGFSVYVVQTIEEAKEAFIKEDSCLTS